MIKLPNAHYLINAFCLIKIKTPVENVFCDKHPSLINALYLN